MPYTTEVIIESLLILTANTLLIKLNLTFPFFAEVPIGGQLESLLVIDCKVTGGYASVYYTMEGDLHTA